MIIFWGPLQLGHLPQERQSHSHFFSTSLPVIISFPILFCYEVLQICGKRWVSPLPLQVAFCQLKSSVFTPYSQTNNSSEHYYFHFAPVAKQPQCCPHQGCLWNTRSSPSPCQHSRWGFARCIPPRARALRSIPRDICSHQHLCGIQAAGAGSCRWWSPLAFSEQRFLPETQIKALGCKIIFF